jgi:hypothetical protein
LSPASDTGESSSDGITNNNQPTFTGTATPGQIITLIAFGAGATSGTIIGQTVATNSGTWSITPSSPLADGSYVIDAEASGTGQASSVIQLLPGGTAGPLVIDTVGPTVNSVTVNPPAGTLTFNFAGHQAGLNTAQVLNPNTYVVIGPSGRRDKHVTIALLPGAAAGTTSLQMTLDGGRSLRRGRYAVSIRAAALSDKAGNGLNGSLYFGFPSGAGTTTGNFVMTFQTDGVSATTPTLPASVVAGDVSYLQRLRRALRDAGV